MTATSKNVKKIFMKVIIFLTELYSKLLKLPIYQNSDKFLIFLKNSDFKVRIRNIPIPKNSDF